MPDLKTRMIFISYAWTYNEDYWTLVNWFKEEPNLSWKNYSAPSHDGLLDTTDRGLKQGLTSEP
jgi:hypothetical protein